FRIATVSAGVATPKRALLMHRSEVCAPELGRERRQGQIVFAFGSPEGLHNSVSSRSRLDSELQGDLLTGIRGSNSPLEVDAVGPLLYGVLFPRKRKTRRRTR